MVGDRAGPRIAARGRPTGPGTTGPGTKGRATKDRGMTGPGTRARATIGRATTGRGRTTARGAMGRPMTPRGPASVTTARGRASGAMRRVAHPVAGPTAPVVRPVRAARPIAPGSASGTMRPRPARLGRGTPSPSVPTTTHPSVPRTSPTTGTPTSGAPKTGAPPVRGRARVRRRTARLEARARPPTVLADPRVARSGPVHGRPPGPRRVRARRVGRVPTQHARTRPWSSARARSSSRAGAPSRRRSSPAAPPAACSSSRSAATRWSSSCSTRPASGSPSWRSRAGP